VSFERVYSVTNYYDGPKEGFADYGGHPHHYLYVWDEVKDDYAGTFTLARLDADTMELALEQWNFWRKWEAAFRRGSVPHNTHPGFGGIDARYDHLKAALTSRLKSMTRRPNHFRGLFRSDLDAVTSVRHV
jgi:hypothetical protein